MQRKSPKKTDAAVLEQIIRGEKKPPFGGGFFKSQFAAETIYSLEALTCSLMVLAFAISCNVIFAVTYAHDFSA